MTSISIIGLGKMAMAIATVAERAGMSVQFLGRREVAADQRRPGAQYSLLGEELKGNLVVFAVPFGAYGSLVEQYGEQLAHKVIIDIANPINFKTYDQLDVPADSSTALELTKQLPAGTCVVKAFNVNLGDTLVAGTNGTTQTTVLFAGDYAEGKIAVRNLIEGAGMRAVDAGPLTRARELEALGFLQIIMTALGHTQFESGFTLLP